MTAPVCNPATLRAEPCPGCGRRIHAAPSSRQRTPTGEHMPTGVCDRGHPTHDSHGMCPGCRTRARRAADGRPRRRVKQRVPRSPHAHSYCPHDEGEHCDCEATT